MGGAKPTASASATASLTASTKMEASMATASSSSFNQASNEGMMEGMEVKDMGNLLQNGATQKPEAVLRSLHGLPRSLQVVERMVTQNNYHPKHLVYRNISMQ